MLRIPLSRVAFGALLFATGVWGLARGSFVAIWAPGIQPAALRPAMVIACSLVSAIAGIGLLWEHSAYRSSRVLLALLLLWLVWCKGVLLIRAPAEPASWESLGETAAVLAAAWALARSCDGLGLDRSNSSLTHWSGPRVLYGLVLIAFGVAHFAYPTLTASLVPMWLPSHLLWVYLTGAAYLAAGIALLSDRVARLAAALSSIQMALFGALVWLPKVAAGALDADTLNEAAISFMLAASGWVISTAIKRVNSDQC